MKVRVDAIEIDVTPDRYSDLEQAARAAGFATLREYLGQQVRGLVEQGGAAAPDAARVASSAVPTPAAGRQAAESRTPNRPGPDTGAEITGWYE